MNRPSDELLMRYADGELSPAELDELERLLEADGQATAIVAGIDQLGDVLRALGERRADAAGDIAGAVLARIDAEQSLGSEEAPPESGARPHSGWTVPILAAGLAAAAAAAIWLATPSDSPAPVARSLPAVQPSEPAPAPPQPASMPEDDVAPAVAIEAVDFGSHNGAIFMVSAGNQATPVVWLTDDVAETGGSRTEPL
jgi:anti-sigma factor RsiW